jgi:hypothetical protein
MALIFISSAGVKVIVSDVWDTLVTPSSRETQNPLKVIAFRVTGIPLK